MRKHTLAVMVMTVALMISAVAPAMAKGGPAQGKSLERGNWLSGVAQPVELTPDDISTGTLANGTEYVTIDHRIAADHDGYTTLVQREPVRYKHNVVDTAPANFNSAWLGISGPSGPEIAHKGPMQWYYEVGDDEWVSLTFQFNGKGELVHVNGVRP